MAKKTNARKAKMSPLFSNLKKFEALTEKQQEVMNSLIDGKDALLLGYAGTAKTYMAIHYALDQLKQRNFRTMKVIRSSVASRDIGFLPGSIVEKMAAFEAPYIQLAGQILQRGDAWDCLKREFSVSFEPSSYLRGITFDDTILIIDEVQNMTWEEINTIYTRIGENTQVIICGDHRQEDKGVGKTGLDKARKVISGLDNFVCYNMDVDDIVRSEKVKNWIINAEEV